MTHAYDKPSKSARKRAAHELEELGVQLSRLSNQQLDELNLPERLREAVEAARLIPSHGALRRQHQYIGKIMRDIDAEPIRAAISALQSHHQQHADNLHEIEHWRDRLLSEPALAMQKLADAFPQVDMGALRQLVNNACQSAAGPQDSKAATRLLFRFLRDNLASRNADEAAE